MQLVIIETSTQLVTGTYYCNRLHLGAFVTMLCVLLTVTSHVNTHNDSESCKIRNALSFLYVSSMS